MSLGDFLKLQALFLEVAMLFRSFEVRWILSHGSLLGAWLHQTPVPWDEEGDIILLPKDFERLVLVLGPTGDQSYEVHKHDSGVLRIFSGTIGSLSYDVHDHSNAHGGWTATAVSFRHAEDNRDTTVHLDAFLCKVNGTHVWTDSAILPIGALVPTRRVRFYDWHVPAPNDPAEALNIWYGKGYKARRRCALRQPGDGGAVHSAIQQIAEVGGRSVADNYPTVHNQLTLATGMLVSQVHMNSTLLFAMELNTKNGKVTQIKILPKKPYFLPLGEDIKILEDIGKDHEYFIRGRFPKRVENLWDR
eukprot:gnl/MRDRNA2_/MRDRNA2_181383_c0_seq1.p1 gnl/MRDRNA2_/MRDRNA2_181383_c0~~gnl/MRDRNA2_/MRDRNA2_181383_c0_seq1.p1  ORF type:complete len:345 (-),score=46.25 gnl/MRDRNA2_/MRDRNA2_181383_c0_seq1:115-1026(-)